MNHGPFVIIYNYRKTGQRQNKLEKLFPIEKYLNLKRKNVAISINERINIH